MLLFNTKANMIKVYIHDHYDGDTKEHDLALVKTKDEIAFGSHVAAACLPKQVRNQKNGFELQASQIIQTNRTSYLTHPPCARCPPGGWGRAAAVYRPAQSRWFRIRAQPGQEMVMK